MNNRSDDNKGIERSRVCELANIPRGRHIRWTDAGLLIAKDRYGELDVIRAAAYDELQTHLKPKLAQAVWSQVRDAIDHPGRRLEVVVCSATMSASVARTPKELDRVLPRNEASIVVDLHPRLTRVRERFSEYRQTTAEAGGPAPKISPYRTLPVAQGLSGSQGSL